MKKIILAIVTFIFLALTCNAQILPKTNIVSTNTLLTVNKAGQNFSLTVNGSGGGGSSTLTASYIGYGDGSNNLTGSSSLTYSNSILKINPSVVSTETRSAMPLQIGGDFITIGSSASANVTPTFIEFLKSNGAGGFRACRGTVGFLGSDEMNLSVNMDYTNGDHRYYDVTKNAIWSFLGNNATGNMGYQWVPANNPNTSDIWTAYGCVPFRVDNVNQPTTGKGINGFSKLTTSQINLVDGTNTATVTNTTYSLTFSGGILNQTGLTTIDSRLSSSLGNINYNNGTGTGNDLNLITPFSVNSGVTAINALSYSTTTGYHVGVYSLAEDGNVNVGLIGKSARAKASTTNIGVIGVATNTNATAPVQIGGFFGLTGIADALPASLTSAALMADNGTSTSNILTLRDNATNVLEVLDGGVMVMGNTIRLKGYTVATLPAGTQGDKAFVTDALTPTYNAIAVGGGAVVCEVFYNGTNWITN